MGRILAIDYGGKRTGLAVSDTLRIIASPLGYTDTKLLDQYVDQYMQNETVDLLVIGYPRHKDGTPTALCPAIDKWIQEFSERWSAVEVSRVEESFSSAEAQKLLAEAVKSKKKRQEKGMLDAYSAVVILRRFMEFEL